jgi:hypothetical protein
MNSGYKTFLKNFLVNSCYMEFTKQVYEDEADQYKESIIKRKDDKEIWDKVFNKLHDPFHYLLITLSDEEKSALRQKKVVYEQKTFQEFIDSQVDIKKIGVYDYQRFIKMMEDEGFKNNMVEKYDKEMIKYKLKNELIYLVQLHLCKQQGISKYFTEEEMEDTDIMLDVVPFYEYLGTKGLLMDDIKPINYNTKIDIDSVLQKYEMNTFAMVKNMVC